MLFCLITRTHAIAVMQTCPTSYGLVVYAFGVSKSAEALSRPSRNPLLLPSHSPTHGHVNPIISAALVPPSYVSCRGLVVALSVLSSPKGTLGRSAPNDSPYLRRFVERCPARAPLSALVRDGSVLQYAFGGLICTQAPTQSSCFGGGCACPDSSSR